MSKKGTGASAISTLISSLFDQIEAELIREHFLPLKQRYDDELRRIPRAHPNPAEYVKTRSQRYREDFNDCESEMSLMLSLETSRILSNINRGQESWPTTALPHESEDFHGSTVQASRTGGSPPNRSSNPFDDSNERETDDLAPYAGSPALGARSPSPDQDELYDPLLNDLDTRSITMMPLPAKIIGDTGSPAMEDKEIGERATDGGDELQAEGNVAPQKTSYGSRPTPKTPMTGDKRSRKSMKDWLSADLSPTSKRAKKSLASPFTPTRQVQLPFLQTKKEITLSDIKPGECVHKYGAHSGFYVLRCTRKPCKEKLLPSVSGSAAPSNLNKAGCVVYFTANPLDRNRALSHFRVKGQGHGLTKLKDIYEKYAVRVTDAEEPLNLGDAESTQQFIALSDPNSNRKRSSEKVASDSEIQTDAATPQPSASFNPSDYDKDDNGKDRRQQPTRAAAKAVTTYGPFTIDDEQEDVDTVQVENKEATSAGDEIGRDYQSSDDDGCDSDIPALTDEYARRFARV